MLSWIQDASQGTRQAGSALDVQVSRAAMAGELSALHFRSLRATLAALPSSSAEGAAAHHLRLELERSKAAFRKLLDKPAQSQREKEELEKCALLLSKAVCDDFEADPLNLVAIRSLMFRSE